MSTNQLTLTNEQLKQQIEAKALELADLLKKQTALCEEMSKAGLLGEDEYDIHYSQDERLIGAILSFEETINSVLI